MKSKLRFLSIVATACLLIFVLAAPAAASLTEFQRFTGKVGYSADGFGSTSQAGTISADVPVGSTVQAAFLYTSMFFNSTGVGAGGTLNGTAIAYGATVAQTPTCCDLSMRRADVTSIVKPVIDAGTSGIYNFAITEDDVSQDGEALIVVFSHPSLPAATFAIFDGFSATAGDAFTINFAEPLKTTAPAFFAEMFLGIGFSFTGMASTVTVNTTVITNNAGEFDDGLDPANGSLITVGGFDDPFSPFLPTPADDHERYNIVPQITMSDMFITVTTVNPSNDDNIFLAGFFTYLNLIPLTFDDTADTIANQFVDIPVLDNDDVGNEPVAVSITDAPDNGTTSQSGCTLKDTCVVTYTPNPGFGGIDTFEYTLTDDDGEQSTAEVVVTVDATKAVAEPGAVLTDPVVVLACADDPVGCGVPFDWEFEGFFDAGSGGTLRVECCDFDAVREMLTTFKKRRAFYDVGILDVVAEIAASADTNCTGVTALLEEARLLLVADGVLGPTDDLEILLRPWQRVVPNPLLFPAGAARDALYFGDSTQDFINRDSLKWGACAVAFDGTPDGIALTEENTFGLLGFEVNCDENDIAHRPLTAGASVFPPEGDFPFVRPWSAQCDRSTSGRRSSHLLWLLNMRIDPDLNGPLSTVRRLMGDLLNEILAEVNNVLAEPMTTANTDYLADLADLEATLSDAKSAFNAAAKAVKKNDEDPVVEYQLTVETLDDFTCQALALPPRDNNARGLFTGRGMNAKFMTCSLAQHPLAFDADKIDLAPPGDEDDCLIDQRIENTILDLGVPADRCPF